MEYKMAEAAIMEIIIREFQRLFYESKGRETKLTDRWGRVWRMSWIRGTCELSVLTKGNREKAELRHQKKLCKNQQIRWSLKRNKKD